MKSEAVEGRLAAAEPLCVNCDPPDGFPSMNGLGGGGGDLPNKLLVLENRFAGAEAMRLNSDGLLELAGVTELTGRIGLLFNRGTLVLLDPEGVFELYFDDPSELCKEADEPGGADLSSVESSLELFLANGFKLLNHPARTGAAANNNAPSTMKRAPMAFTEVTP
jgi:hypothetical protein